MDAWRKTAVVAAVLVSGASTIARAQDASITTGPRGNCACLKDVTVPFGQTFTTPNFFTTFLGFSFVASQSEGNVNPYSFDVATDLFLWDAGTNRPTGPALATGVSHYESFAFGPGPSLTPGTAIVLSPNQMYIAFVDLTQVTNFVGHAGIQPEIAIKPTADGGQSTYAGGRFELCGTAAACTNEFGSDFPITISLSVVTPEPSTLLLLAPGIVGLGAMARRRRRR